MIRRVFRLTYTLTANSPLDHYNDMDLYYYDAENSGKLQAIVNELAPCLKVRVYVLSSPKYPERTINIYQYIRSDNDCFIVKTLYKDENVLIEENTFSEIAIKALLLS